MRKFFKPVFRRTSILIILLITIQTASCSSESTSTATNNDNSEPDTRTKNEANNAAVISGDSNGSVTEDNDPDNNNLLETLGNLNITDNNAGEAAFIAATINGIYGDLTIDVNGNWAYAAKNNQAAIQNLTSGATLNDKLTVSSLDGTTHIISITIIGVDEFIATKNIALSWTAPSAREDNTPIVLSEITGYKIYYGTTPGLYPDNVFINDGTAVDYIFQNFVAGNYYFVVTTVDSKGLESQYSTAVMIII